MITNLIPAVDFILQECEKSELNSITINANLRRYAEFLKQPLKKGFFVPCDETGLLLEEKHRPNINDYRNHEGGNIELYNFNMNEYRKYNAAKNRVLFDGWKLIDPKKRMGHIIVYSDDFEINLTTLSCGQYIEDGYLDGQLTGNTIEAIANLFRGIPLTPTAIKQIYG